MNKGAQTQATILNHAVAMAGVHGLDGMSIARLARATGMSKSGLFGHFGSKVALQRAVLEAAAKEFVRRVLIPAQQERTGEARLRALFHHWLQWLYAEERPGGCPLVSASIEFADRPGEVHDYLVDQQEAWVDRIRRMSQKAVAEGNFREGLDTRQFAFEFHSIGLGFNFARRLFSDSKALTHANTALDQLIDAAKRSRQPRLATRPALPQRVYGAHEG
ncbi:MAG: TetR/AcrR family transcriptional regulator [Gammaproteobacteria bacterium]